jgi:predicted nucleotidyltransferase
MLNRYPNGTMNAAAAIKEARKRLVQALHPERIILFGSHVWGTPGPDSDLDLLVIVGASDLPPHKRASSQPHRETSRQMSVLQFVEA